MKRIRLDDLRLQVKQTKIQTASQKLNGKKVSELKQDELFELIELLTDLSGYLDETGKIRMDCKV